MASKKGKAIVVTSGKGGVGKTTTTANLGTALALRGNTVVVIDADIGLRNLDVVLGLENRIVYDLVQLIEGNCQLHQAMIRDKSAPNLSLIPAAQTRDKASITPEQLTDIVDQLKPDHDYILIDSPAGIEQGFKNSLAPADVAIVVTTPEVSAVRDADRIIGLVEASGLPTPRLILNRVRAAMIKQNDMMSTEDILTLLSVQLVGVVPEDESIIVSTNRGVPAVHDPKSVAGQAYIRVAARLDGEDVPFMDLSKQPGLLHRFKKWLSPAGRVETNA